MISGHFDFNYIKDFLDGSYSFIFLRDPIERTVSLYNYFLQWPINYTTKKWMPQLEMVQRMSIQEFVEFEENRVSNVQTRLLHKSYSLNKNGKDADYYDPEILISAKKNMHKFSFIGFKETFKKDFYNILMDLNIPLPIRNKVVNKSRNHPSQIYVKSLSPVTYEKLESKVRLDRKLYLYAWNNLRRT